MLMDANNYWPNYFVELTVRDVKRIVTNEYAFALHKSDNSVEIWGCQHERFKGSKFHVIKSVSIVNSVRYGFDLVMEDKTTITIKCDLH